MNVQMPLFLDARVSLVSTAASRWVGKNLDILRVSLRQTWRENESMTPRSHSAETCSSPESG